MTDNKHFGHRDRVRKRFVDEGGFDSFNDHQVLEALLYLCIPRKDTNEIAHCLLKEFGSFSAVLEASPENLVKVEGVSKTVAINISMIKSFCNRYYNDKLSSDNILDTPEKISEFILPKFLGCTDERIYCICLNNVCKLISCDLISKGDISAATLTVRMVVENALKHNAKNIVLAHNHPQGLSVPSNNDIVVTKEIEKGLKTIGIRLVDHFIVADNDTISLKQSNFI